jgi:hypothetical protein
LNDIELISKLLITNNAFCIVQRATAPSKTSIFRDYGVAKAPPGFQAGWSDFMLRGEAALLDDRQGKSLLSCALCH